jgi:hypothetical protein
LHSAPVRGTLFSAPGYTLRGTRSGVHAPGYTLRGTRSGVSQPENFGWQTVQRSQGNSFLGKNMWAEPRCGPIRCLTGRPSWSCSGRATVCTFIRGSMIAPVPEVPLQPNWGGMVTSQLRLEYLISSSIPYTVERTVSINARSLSTVSDLYRRVNNLRQTDAGKWLYRSHDVNLLLDIATQEEQETKKCCS